MNFPSFAFGWLCLALTLLMPLIYLSGYGLRWLASWFNNTERPKERVAAYVVLAAAFGLVTGSLLQSPWNQLSQCRAQGKSGSICLWEAMNPGQRP